MANKKSEINGVMDRYFSSDEYSDEYDEREAHDMHDNPDISDTLEEYKKELEEAKAKAIAEIIDNSRRILEESEGKPGRPRKTEDEKVGKYKFNLGLDKDQKYYIQNIAWQKRKSITQYVRDLIEKDRQEYFKNGGTTEGWEEVF